jgi:phosphatidylserine/phosphatidylglycerophosphate/cardiolipin synthase-like enzyme
MIRTDRPLTSVRPASRPVVASAPERKAKPAAAAGDSRVETQAPVGKSPIGTAVNQAVWNTNRGTVDRSQAFTQGSVEAVWHNDTDESENEIINHVIEELKSAKSEIDIQTYVWDVDKAASIKLLDALAAKQKENPDFKINVFLGLSWSPLDKLSKEFAKRGMTVNQARFFDVKTQSANHSKMYVFDGHTAILSSANVENKRMVDTAFKLRGPVVDTMMKDFDQGWMTAAAWTSPDGKELPKPSAPPSHVKLPAPTAATGTKVPMTLLSKAGRGVDAVNPRVNNSNEAMLAAMKAASKTIKLQTPNLNDPGVLASLEAASRRGVKVEVLMPRHFNQVKSQLAGGGNNDMAIRWWAQLPADVQKNIDVRWYSGDGEKREYNHTKYMSIDDSWLYMGSQNFDMMSWEAIREMGIGIDDADEVKRLDALTFDKAWATSVPATAHWYDKHLPIPPQELKARLKQIFTNPLGLLGEITFNPFSPLADSVREKFNLL